MSAKPRVQAACAWLTVGATLGCLNFDQEGGAKEAFCKERPELCAPVVFPGGGGGVGGGGGGSGGGGGGQSTAANCAELDPGDVHLFGDLVEGYGTPAIAALASPSKPCIGFGDPNRVRIRPDAKILYSQYGVDSGTLLEMKPDSFDPTSDWFEYPLTAAANDTAVATTCENLGLNITGLQIRPDTGEFVVKCGGGSGNWFDEAGVEIDDTYDVIGAGKDGTLLLDSGRIRFTDGTRVSATGLATHDLIIATRARPDGFWVATENAISDVQSLYHLGFDGTALKLVDYSAPPADASVGGSAAIDASGDLYVLGGTVGLVHDLVVRFPRGGGASTVVYTEENQPKDGRSVVIHIGAQLVTGPGELQ